MRRVLFALVTTFSSLMLCACVVLWCRSYRVANGVAWNDGSGRQREVVSYAGGVHVREVTNYPATGGTGAWTVFKEQVPQGADWQTRCGGNMHVVWERGGFVAAAGNNPVIFLTGWTYPVNQVRGTVTTTTSLAPNAQVVAQPNFIGTSAVMDSSSSMLVTVGGEIIQVTDGDQAGIVRTAPVQIITGGNLTGIVRTAPVQTLTAQTIAFAPAGGSGTWQLAVVVPYWAIALLSGLLPAYCAAKVPGAVRRMRRIKKGLCVSCGYDLRASPDRCPECGTAAHAR